MSEADQDNIFDSDIQNSIFGMLMALILQYNATMDSIAAANKACDWLISLAETVKSKSVEAYEETKTKQDTFKNKQ